VVWTRVFAAIRTTGLIIARKAQQPTAGITDDSDPRPEAPLVFIGELRPPAVCARPWTAHPRPDPPTPSPVAAELTVDTALAEYGLVRVRRIGQ